MKAVCETIGVARSNVAERAAGRSPKRRGRPPLPDGELLERIKAVIADMPSYGYARVWAVLRRDAIAEGRAPVNRKRVYRVMRSYGLLLLRHAGGADERRHDGKIAVARSNLRWCSDGFEITCDNAEKVRVAFALDCCDREAVGHVATTEGIKGEDVRDLMVAAVEQRFGPDQSTASDDRMADRQRLLLCLWRNTQVRPRDRLRADDDSRGKSAINGMAEAFVRTIKRDYVRVNPTPDAQTVMRSLPKWFDHYNQLHPHRALGYRSPREFIADRSTKKVVEPVSGN